MGICLHAVLWLLFRGVLVAERKIIKIREDAGEGRGNIPNNPNNPITPITPQMLSCLLRSVFKEWETRTVVEVAGTVAGTVAAVAGRI